MAQHPGCPEADNSFGPVVPSTCRGGFDFTLLFEHIFLAAIPAAVLIVAAAVRLWKLRHAPTVTSGALLQWTKQVRFFFFPFFFFFTPLPHPCTLCWVDR